MVEPVTTVILAAIAAGATAGLTDTAKQAIADSYAGMKALLKRKFGGESKMLEAVEKLERDPESAGWKETVGKEAAKAGANQDRELIAAAEAVLAKLKELPAGAQQHIQSAVGSYIAQADRGGTAKVNVNRKE
jgi:hypothetical protein